MNRRKGFSLIELLVAMTLGLIILGVIAFAFHHASMASTRSLALLEMNNKVRAASTLIERELGSINHLGAMSATATTLVFMLNVPSRDIDYDGTDDYEHEIGWVKYEFVLDASTTGDTTDYILKRGFLAPGAEAPNSSMPAAATNMATTEIMSGLYKIGVDDFLTIGGGTVTAYNTNEATTTRHRFLDMKFKVKAKGERGAEFEREFAFRCALP